MLINLNRILWIQHMSSSTSSQTVDNEKLQKFMGKVLSDFGEPITSQELANLTATSERYIREWLANQAAGGYLTYDASSQRYTLPYEHAQALVNETSPAYVAGGFQVLMCFYRDEPKLLEAFKTGKGI